MARDVVQYKPGILNRLHWNPLAFYAAIMFMFLLAPGFVVIILSFSSSTFMEFPPPGFSLQWYGTFFKDEQLLTALGISLQVAFAATILSILIGTLAAFSLSRYTIRGGKVIRLAMLAPFIVPWIVQATGLYRLFALLGIGRLCRINCSTPLPGGCRTYARCLWNNHNQTHYLTSDQ